MLLMVGSCPNSRDLAVTLLGIEAPPSVGAYVAQASVAAPRRVCWAAAVRRCCYCETRALSTNAEWARLFPCGAIMPPPGLRPGELPRYILAGIGAACDTPLPSRVQPPARRVQPAVSRLMPPFRRSRALSAIHAPRPGQPAPRQQVGLPRRQQRQGSHQHEGARQREIRQPAPQLGAEIGQNGRRRWAVAPHVRSL